MKVAEIVNFKAASEPSHIAPPVIAADPNDVRLLIACFLECNTQYMIGVVNPMATETFCNDTIATHLAEQGLQTEAEYEAYVLSLLDLLGQCRRNPSLIHGLTHRNLHVLDRMILRLQMEMLPTAALTAKQLRSVLSYTGVPHRLEEFIAMSRDAAYVRWHWGDMIALAEQQGGHALRAVRVLVDAYDALEDNTAEAPIDVQALAMGQF